MLDSLSKYQSMVRNYMRNLVDLRIVDYSTSVPIWSFTYNFQTQKGELRSLVNLKLRGPVLLQERKESQTSWTFVGTLSNFKKFKLKMESWSKLLSFQNGYFLKGKLEIFTNENDVEEEFVIVYRNLDKKAIKFE